MSCAITAATCCSLNSRGDEVLRGTLGVITGVALVIIGGLVLGGHFHKVQASERVLRGALLTSIGGVITLGSALIAFLSYKEG